MSGNRLNAAIAVEQTRLHAASNTIETGKPAAPGVERVQQGATLYEKGKVIVSRENEVGGGGENLDKFTIPSRAELTLISTLQDYITHFEDPVLATTLDADQKTFLRQFRATFGGKDYKPEDLHTYVEKFVRDPSGFGMVVALKVAEWKITTIQQASGAQFEENQSHVVTHRPDSRIAGVNAPILSESTPRKSILGFRRANKITDTPMTTLGKAEEAARRNAPIEERDTTYHFDVSFPDVSQLRYDITNLNPAQRAYLQSIGIIPETITDGASAGSREASAEKNRVREILSDLTSARVEVYQSLGKYNIDLNLATDAGLPIGDRRPFLLIEHKASGGGDARTAIEGQLKYATQEMEKKIKKIAADKAKEAKATKKEEEKTRKINLIKDKKLETSADPPPPSPGDEKKIKANDEEREKEETKKTELKKAVEDGKKLPELKKTADDAQLALGADFAIVETINKGVDSAGIAPAGSLIQAQELFEVAKTATEDAKDIRDLARTRQQKATDAYHTIKPTTDPKVMQSALDEYDATRDISAQETAYTIARSAEAAAKRELAKRQAIQDKYKSEWQAHVDAQRALESAVKQYRETAAKYTIKGSGADVYGITGLTITEGNLTTAVTAAEKRVEDLIRESAKLADPNKLARKHQNAVYEKFDEELTPQDKIKLIGERASGLKDRKKEDYVVPESYEQYPEAYIHTLRVMFGWEVTNFSNAAEFKRATLMLPPEVFMAEMTALEPTFFGGITDIYDPRLKPGTPESDAMVAKLSAKHMHDLHSRVIDLGARGVLGELSPAIVQELEDIQQRTATDIFIAPPNPGGVAPDDRNNLITTISQEIYYFEDADDLARRIWTRQTAAGSNYMSGTAHISNQDEAKAYAMEIARLRK